MTTLKRRRMTAAIRRTSALGPFARQLEAARHGNVNACYRVGRAYMTGRGAPHYPADALKWLRRAAREDHAEAQYWLSRLYLKGAKARSPVQSWLAEANDRLRTRSNAALLYPDGVDIEPDPRKAFGWATEAARQGLARAQAHLGMLYLRGVGCGQDFVQAAAWFRLSAAQNEAGGALGLAILHEHGLGMKQSLAEAARWYRRAAGQGNNFAATALTRLESRPSSFALPPEIPN